MKPSEGGVPWSELAVQRSERQRRWVLGLNGGGLLLLLVLVLVLGRPVTAEFRDQGLCAAVRAGNPAGARYWLKLGANPNRQMGFPHRRPLLYYVVERRDLKVVQTLLDAGAAPDLPGCERSTTALAAAKKQAEREGDRRCLDLLMRYVPPSEGTPDDAGRTPEAG